MRDFQTILLKVRWGDRENNRKLILYSTTESLIRRNDFIIDSLKEGSLDILKTKRREEVPNRL